MGKGDKKTKRGKISKGTFGVSRPRKSSEQSTTPKSKTTKGKAAKKSKK